MFPSKADRILSRYRPIAPKPAAFPPPSASLASDPSSSCASLDSFASRSLPESSKFKRPRKRRSDASSSPKPPAKLAKSDRIQVRPGGGAPVGGGVFSAGGSSLTQGTSDCAVPDLDPRSVSQASLPSPCMSLGDGSVDICRPVLCDRVEPADLGTVRCGGVDTGLPFARGNAVHGGMARAQRMSPVYFGGSGMFERDVAFMERAAANAPSSVLPDKGMAAESTSKSGAFVGGFTEMIRGITRLPTAADVHSLMQVRMASENRSFSTVPSLPHDPQRRSTLPQTVNAVMSSHDGVDRDLAAVSPVPEDEPSCSNPKLVTLPLLPETPSLADSPSESSLTSCTVVSALSRGCEIQSGSVAGSGHLKLGLFGSLRSSGSSSSAAVDQAYLEQFYGGSTDPVLLLDDSQQVLWFNRAYERASKSTSDRNPSGPYIDPLGHPTPLGSFTLHSFGQPTNSSATLWGFLKKLVVQEPELLNDESDGFYSSTVLSNDAGNSEQVSELSLRLGDAEIFSAEKHSLNPTVLGSSQSTGTNSPANPSLTIGCIATLECVTEVHLDALPMTGTREAVEARLQLQGSLPSFMTDCSNRVTWVNSAYRKLVDLRGLWLTSSPASVSHDVFEGAVTTLCLSQRIPHSAAAFSGRVNLQWIKAGVKSAMTVPCDVCRLITESGVDMWVWKFDVAASLRLTCGALS